MGPLLSDGETCVVLSPINSKVQEFIGKIVHDVGVQMSSCPCLDPCQSLTEKHVQSSGSLIQVLDATSMVGLAFFTSFLFAGRPL